MTYMSRHIFTLLSAAAVFLMMASAPNSAWAQNTSASQAQTANTYEQDQILQTGHQFFGSVSGGLASVVEKVFASYGEPNGYILGEEGSGAFVAGARYGEGQLYTRNAGNHKIFWQGPSVGFDFGADGARVMMLIYNLPSVETIYQRYSGINGSAYLVGGVGMTVLGRDSILVVPIKAGVGARLGLNMGYLKFTQKATWNPF